MKPLITVVNISKSFNKTIAVNHINFCVEAGEIYGLLGPDGAGKTTTLRLLCGALCPTLQDAVEHNPPPGVEIAGFDILNQTERAREQIGYLPQRFSLYEELTVLENLRFFGEVRGLSSSDWRSRSMEILEFVGLAEFKDRRAGHLSGGMKQKLGLAAALVHSPRVILLDEPTTGVDPVTRQDFWQLIIRLVAENQEKERTPAVLVSTPYMDEAARCTRVGFMHRGKLILEGAPSSIVQSLEGQILELRGKPLRTMRSIVNADGDVLDVQMFGDRLHIHVKPEKINSVIDRLQAQMLQEDIEVFHLRSVSPQLEDVFMHIVTRDYKSEHDR